MRGGAGPAPTPYQRRHYDRDEQQVYRDSHQADALLRVPPEYGVASLPVDHPVEQVGHREDRVAEGDHQALETRFGAAVGKGHDRVRSVPWRSANAEAGTGFDEFALLVGEMRDQ